MQSSTARPSLRMPTISSRTPLRAFGIESGSRLIEEDDAWLMDDGARERDPLLESLREPCRAVLASVGDPNSARASFTALSGSASP